MILENLSIRGTAGEKQLIIQSGCIKTVEDDKGTGGDKEARIRFDNAIVFPGLINSHDHLDFDLFPSLANRIYTNYTDWAKDIHQNNKELIDKVLKVPQSLRVEWGCYKNLLNGFTTVVNHGKKIKISKDILTVFQDCYSLHSPAFEKNWKLELNNPLKTRKPFVMHIGEGTDEKAGKEISEVSKWNSLFRKKIIAIHGIAMNKEQAAAFNALVWCPASNYFLTGQTAEVKELKKTIPVVFGTDSTLSSPWNAWEHFRMARDKTNIGEDELMDMLTTIPAQLWKLNSWGIIEANAPADIVIARKPTRFFDLNPEDILLVIRAGRIRLYDESIAPQLQPMLTGAFSRIGINNRTKFVEGDMTGLLKKIQSYLPGITFPVSV